MYLEIADTPVATSGMTDEIPIVGGNSPFKAAKYVYSG